MSPNDELLRSLDELRKRTASFRRVALHVHSPDSHDWGKDGDKTLNDRENFLKAGGEQAFVEALRPHFDLVAITDHMKCSYASTLSKVTHKDDSFLILPGMEVNFRPEAAITLDRLHLIVLLPEQSSPERFAELFAGLEFPDDADRTGNEEVSGINLVEWVKRVHDVGGLCIAAHVDGNQGLRRHFRQTSHDIFELFDLTGDEQKANEAQVSDELKEYLFDGGFDGIEIAKCSDRRHYRWLSEKGGQVRTIPIVLTFDAHCIENFDKPERVTWIKMTTLGLAGLRDALKFPETRIRFKSDLPTPPSPCLLGIEIVGSQNTFFNNLRIAFAQNLNCLIGARGSGKSTVVEALRYAFGYNRTLNELDTTNKLSEQIREMQKANLTDCLIRVVYRTQNADIRILEATFDSQEDYVTKVFGADGEALNVGDVETTGDFPLRLFGWSEIETLGRDSTRQRDLLDRLISELPVVRRERDEIRARLRANRAEIEAIIVELNEIFTRSERLIQRFTEYKEDFDTLNTDAVKKHFAALDLALGKKRILKWIRANVESLADKIKNLGTSSIRDELDELLKDEDKDLRDWWLSKELAILKVVDVETDAQKHLDDAVSLLASFKTLLGQHIDGTDKNIDISQAELREAFSEDTSLLKITDLRQNAEKRLREAKVVRDEYLGCWKRLGTCLVDRKSIAESLIACQDRITGIREQHNQQIEDALNSFFDSGMNISLKLRAGRDQARFFDELTGVASSIAHNYKKRAIRELLTEHFNPVTLSRVYLDASPGQLANKSLSIDSGKAISADEAKKSLEARKPWSHDEHAQVESLSDDGRSLIALLKLEEVEWDDEVSILLNERPVDEVSPGQRSSAMLPLIALSEKTPLVIDQPEDNLDNKLIGKVLTNILAKLKEHRQIIVCTHNPNIVVSGDAEQVVVLEALSDRRARVVTHGSIDNEDIVKSVIDIMEGGKEAFQVRMKRYGM